MRSLVLIVALVPFINAQFQLFPHGTDSTAKLSEACTTALNATITCDPYIQQLAVADYYGSLGNATLQELVCAAACGTSLASYHARVTAACASEEQPWPGVPAVWAGDVTWATYNRTCLKDPTTGHYCVDEVAAINTGNIDQRITSLSSPQLCSPCMIALLKGIQSTPYSNYGAQNVQDWLTIQSQCNTGPLPTAPQPPAANMTDPSGVTTSNPANRTCLSGNHYTVQSGDDVQKISATHGVATGTLNILNGIFPDGTNLFAGQELCLPKPCPTYIVKQGDTCPAIAGAHGISSTQLVSYNPAINVYCTNLIPNTTICVGLSGPQFKPTTIPGATATTANYATATVTPPGAVPFGTTKNCGKYYQANPGDNCQQISLNNTITVQSFQEINPSVNSNCTNLTPGLYYCVWPTASWNTTANNMTSTTASPPAPTPPGSTSICYEWHTIISGDTCSLVGTSYGITFAQFQSWNPQVNAQCSNLLLGDAYCVNAPAMTVTTTSSTVTSTSTSSLTLTSSTPTGPVTPPGPTQSGIASNCNKYVMQQTGLFCTDMADNAAITLAQLYTWNPALNGDCSGLWVGYAYCIGVTL